MDINLSKLAKTPKDRWFYLAMDKAGVGLVRVKADHMPRPQIALRLMYLDRRALRSLGESAMERSPQFSEGVKSIDTVETDAWKEALCRAVIQDWQITVAGAYQLQAHCEFGDLPADTPIVFSGANRDFLAKRSGLVMGTGLAAVVSEIISDHSAWFDSPAVTSPPVDQAGDEQAGEQAGEQADDESPVNKHEITDDNLGNLPGGPSGSMGSSHAESASEDISIHGKPSKTSV